MGFQLCSANKYLSAKNSASDNIFNAWNANKIIFRVRCFLHVPVATLFQTSENHVIFFGSSRAFEKVYIVCSSKYDMVHDWELSLSNGSCLGTSVRGGRSFLFLEGNVVRSWTCRWMIYEIPVLFRELLMSQRKWHVFRRSEMVWPPEREENNGLEKYFSSHFRRWECYLMQNFSLINIC